MPTTPQAVTQAIKQAELQAFGLAMPRLAPNWAPKGAPAPTFTIDDAAMTISNSGHWAAPLDMAFLLVDGSSTQMPVTLTRTDGSSESGAGVLLTQFDQAWLRLNRLYTQVLETNTPNRLEFGRGLPFRPVPRYIFFPGQTIAPKAGLAEAWADLGFSGQATFYDGDGLPIDPVAVMAAFAAILTQFPLLQAVDIGDTPLAPLPLSQQLITMAPTPAKTRLRFVNPDGSSYGGQHLTNLNAVSASSGLYELNGANVGLDAVSGSFTQDDHDRLVFGPATSGRLTGSFVPPVLAGGVNLARDFYTIRVVNLNDYLIGQWPSSGDDPAVSVQRKPAVRINENATFLADGNDVLGAITAALTGGANPSIAVAQSIDGNFAIPPAPGANAHWPQFPPGVPNDPNATLSTTLKKQLQLTANWVTATASDIKKADVVLQIEHLPANAWVRIYPRKFIQDAREARADGAAGLVPASGKLTLALNDPFSLKNPNDPSPGSIIVPAKAVLMFDLAVVLPNGNSRIYGNLQVNVAPAPGIVPASAATNPAGTAGFRGVSNAGILGLGTPGNAPNPGPGLANLARALAGEAQPRDAPRFPTMARRELLVAGGQAGVWTGVIGAGRIAPEAISAASRIGAPGSPGGRETSVTGVTTHGGILAWDIARHAFRRSDAIPDRIVQLADNRWNVPAQPAAVGIGQSPGPTNGTFAGAVLQTVAPYCETPELHVALEAGVNINTAIDYVKNNLVPAGLPGRTQVLNALDGLKTTPAVPAPASETSAEQRIAVELEREVTSSFFGRRDAQWALKSAIKSARHLIYIETPGFCSTAAASSPPGYAADLIALLKSQLNSRPGLRLIVCVPQFPDFAPGYEGMFAYEVTDRLALIKGKTTSPVVTPIPPNQTALFHPIGFPGRFARVETNVVIVDDNWIMIGGATFRRRGFTFDGSSDLVVTDTLIENGRSAAIREYRRTLMANRLGIPPVSTQPSYVALSEPATAFKLVKDALDSGGLGDIAPIWDGAAPGFTLATPLPIEQSNPEGRDFDIATAILVSAFAAASGV
jgi:hypothetical protein